MGQDHEQRVSLGGGGLQLCLQVGVLTGDVGTAFAVVEHGDTGQRVETGDGGLEAGNRHAHRDLRARGRAAVVRLAVGDIAAEADRHAGHAIDRESQACMRDLQIERAGLHDLRRVDRTRRTIPGGTVLRRGVPGRTGANTGGCAQPSSVGNVAFPVQRGRGREGGSNRGRRCPLLARRRGVEDRHCDRDEGDDRGRDGERLQITGAAARRRLRSLAERVDDTLRPGGWDGDLVRELGEEAFEYCFVDHGVVTSASGAYAARRASAASRLRASCRRDLTVPGRRRIAVAISRSLRSA